MKKAFDQNVSRAKPRLRLGSFTEPAAPPAEETVPAAAAEVEQASLAPTQETADLGTEVRARVERSRQPALPAVEVLERALQEDRRPAPAPDDEEPVRVASKPHASTAAPAAPRARGAAPEAPLPAAPAPRAWAEPPPPAVEVQTPPPPRETLEQEHASRRERLKERLKNARENPRPEPLPATVAQAGVLAVERIATLQTELTKMKALNLALTQDLESTRRHAERATEEARLRMDEAQRLASEMEGRVALLRDLERELGAIEGERDEALLTLQESRQILKAAGEEREQLKSELQKRDQALSDSLSEEERLAGELESVQEEAGTLRRTLDAVSSERDTLARQVSDLTAERAELLEARKALEAVHRALSSAVQR